jgi:toxin ParE1/3/4
MRVAFRLQARNDLKQIFQTILERSQDTATARQFTQRIKDRCDRIGDAPSGGRSRDDLEIGLRTVPFERSAVIAYRIDHGQVRITNVFYGGRDFERLYEAGEVPPETMA